VINVNSTELHILLLTEKAKSETVFYQYRKEKGSSYIYNLPCSFDIETSSTYLKEEKTAFMYIWMFGINDLVIYGRTWEEFQWLIQKVKRIFSLSEKKILRCYVHNLGYEFQFMKDFFTWENVFAVDERKPIKALSSDFIEFRDSYILSGMNLAKTAENLVSHSVKKLVGNLDYKLVRTPKTELSDLELAYCENDILVVNAYIAEQIEQYGTIGKIPLTNTGKVRNFVREKCFFTNKNHKKSNTGKFKRYSTIMKDLQVRDEEEYLFLKSAFMGGFTHGNPSKVGKVLKNVSSYDFTSSYPTVMLSEKFPMSSSMDLNPKNLEEFNKMRTKFLMVFQVKFEGLIAKFHEDYYLSENKCIGIENKVVANGRIVKADKLITTITNIDFNIIEQVYTWEKISISKCIGYYANYLPKPIIESVLELYQNKTELKGVKGKEVEYLVSKGMINSTYGMCVTDIIQETNTYQEGEWVKVENDKSKQLETYNKSKKRFLFYPWGIFITAYARSNLWTGIINASTDYCYSDTDSLKLENAKEHEGYFKAYNDLIIRKLNAMCTYYNIDPSLLSPKTIKGVSKPIGVWDYEGTYSRFKTLGAKRYLIEEEGELEITVAGLSKRNGLEYMLEACNHDNSKVFKMFNDELFIPSAKTGKNTHTYIDEEQAFFIKDYLGEECFIRTKGGVHLEECEFTLSISKEFKEFIDHLRRGEVFKGYSKNL